MKRTTTSKAVGYVRVSTAGQAADGASLEAQRARIAATAAAAGLELVAVHADEGLSGKRADNRPGLVAALDAACRQRAVLVVYSLSRMSRSVTDTLTIIERLDRAGAGLVSITESIDTTTAAGRMMVTMISAFAAFERELTSERTATVLAHKRSQGQRTGTVPYGFTLDADGITLVEDTDEQIVLRRIEDCRRAGLSLRAIADELNAAGVIGKQGGTWHASTVASVLKRAAAVAA